MFKEIIKPALILFIICVIITGALAAVYQVTAPIIAEREELDKIAALQVVLPDASGFEPALLAADLSAKGIQVPATVQAIYPGTKDGTAVGVVVEVAPRGYGGAVRMLVGVTVDGLLTSVKIMAQNETPGLGTKAADPEFIDQYKALPVDTTLQVVKTGSTKQGEINAISGATITSRAVTLGVSEALKLAKEVQ